MVESGSDFRLAQEAGDAPGSQRTQSRQDLERHHPMEAFVLREVDDALPAAPQLFDHAIRSDALGDAGRRSAGIMRFALQAREPLRDDGVVAGEHRDVLVERSPFSRPLVLEVQLQESVQRLRRGHGAMRLEREPPL